MVQHCTYGSTEQGERSPESTGHEHAASIRVEDPQYRTSARIRVFASSFAMLAVILMLTEALNLSPMNIDATLRDDQSSLLQDSSESTVLTSIAESTLSTPKHSSSLEEFRWKKVSDNYGSYHIGFLEFCNIANDTFFYRTAQSAEDPDDDDKTSNSTYVPCENATSTVSPVIRMRPRTNYKLILINRSNQPTNLHTHGLHVSGVGIFDDITRNVEPGFCLEYHYRIKDSADVGTFWYHSHRHPIAANQVSGGAYGLLIIDEPHMETFPLHVQRLFRNEVLLQYACIRHKDKIHRTHLLNGKKEATNITLSSSEFYYFRVSFVILSDPVSYFEIMPSNACEARPMAYDGVFRSILPHPKSSSKHMMTVSSRLDLAIQCQQDAQVVFHQGNLSDGANLLNIQVVDDSDDDKSASSTAVRSSPFWDAVEKTSWAPRRPYYMPDLANVNTNFWKVNKWNVTMDYVMIDDGNSTNGNATKQLTINKIHWDPNIAIRELQLGQLVEWTLYKTATHPFHIHVNKMQIVQEGGCGDRYEEGQYYDTITSKGPCLVRLQFWDFSGRIVAHCHRLSHEDKGMMVWIDVKGSDHGVDGTKQAECSSFSI